MDKGPAASVISIDRSAMERHRTLLKSSFEVRIVVAPCAATLRSLKAACIPRKKCFGRGAASMVLHSMVRNIDIRLPGGSSKAYDPTIEMGWRRIEAE